MNQPVSMEHVVKITHVNVKTSGKDPTAIHLVSIFMYMQDEKNVLKNLEIRKYSKCT